MASAVSEAEEAKRRRKKKKVRHSKELLDHLPKPAADLDSKLRELGGSKGRGSKRKREPGPPQTFRVETSSVLSRVRGFLPEMEKADKELKSLLCSNDQKKEDLNIETVREGGPCIEMDMAVIPMLGSESEDEGVGSDVSEEEGREERDLPGLYLPLSAGKKPAKHRTLIEEVK